MITECVTFSHADYMKLNAERIIEARRKGNLSIGGARNLRDFLANNDDGSPEYAAWVREFIEELYGSGVYTSDELKYFPIKREGQTCL